MATTKTPATQSTKPAEKAPKGRPPAAAAAATEKAGKPRKAAAVAPQVDAAAPKAPKAPKAERALAPPDAAYVGFLHTIHVRNKLVARAARTAAGLCGIPQRFLRDAFEAQVRQDAGLSETAYDLPAAQRAMLGALALDTKLQRTADLRAAEKAKGSKASLSGEGAGTRGFPLPCPRCPGGCGERPGEGGKGWAEVGVYTSGLTRHGDEPHGPPAVAPSLAQR